MNNLSHYFLSSLIILSSILAIELVYMYSNSSLHVKSKNSFVYLTGLPDLALSNSANFVRHRSYSDTFSLFSNGPELLEYFPSTFTYNFFTKNPSRIELEN